MGRGDKRTKRGKICRNSYGVSRPKPSKLRKEKEAELKAPAPAA